MGSQHGDSPRSNAHEEKILVSIRLRPLNDKEVSYNETVDWECISNTTLMFNNKPPENQNSPAAYSFDRVFGSDCSTRQVYEEAAKSVALSVVSGINSSIFAYGQTSSGKTYTMSGITQYTIADIYDYVEKNTSRQFTLKFSAMEIYNEAVRDLLSSDSTPLRLLDDPERGTVVERLTEFTLRDRSHLIELLSICEAERKIGETALNEMSSRSHQILRLVVESSPREYNRFENAKNLAATVNFVDLAGSERASQTKSAGTRLKEGCHINRSLLTLGTVIRKLSKSRNGHVPYRDSKLTRILQNSLGGNARTAIICTMSPAHSHLEQSRNTLLFANCAKQVRTNAHVNMMMSEKALIKQLQKELVRLEAQLRNLGSLSNSGDSLKEKELLIEKMEDEIRELTQQRDQAHFRLNNFAHEPEENRSVKHWDEQSNVSEPPHEKHAWFEEYPASESSETHFSDKSEGRILNKHEELFPDPPEEQFLSNDTSPRMFFEKYFGPDPTQEWENTAAQGLTATNSEDVCKEVRCIEEVDTNTRKMHLDSENQENVDVKIDHESETTLKPAVEDLAQKIHPEPLPEPRVVDSSTTPSKQDKTSSIADKELLESSSPTTKGSKQDEIPSIEDKEPLESSSPTTDAAKEEETPSIVDKEPLESSSQTTDAPKEDETQTPSIVVKERLESVEPEPSHERDLSLESVDSDGIDDKAEILMSMRVDDKVMKSEEQFKNDIVKEAESILPQNTLAANDPPKSPASWAMEFEKQRAEIIQLWDTCHIPLVHRSYFFLVFKGDPSDAIYLEVELRRLSYLKESKNDKNDHVSSAKEMNHERHMLSRLMLKKFSAKEREALFQKWGVGVKTKRRRNQLCKKLWTNTEDMEHVKESAALIGKLVGLVELNQARKEIVGLSFSTPQVNLHVRSFSWIPSLV